MSLFEIAFTTVLTRTTQLRAISVGISGPIAGYCNRILYADLRSVPLFSTEILLSRRRRRDIYYIMAFGE